VELKTSFLKGVLVWPFFTLRPPCTSASTVCPRLDRTEGKKKSKVERMQRQSYSKFQALWTSVGRTQ